MIKFKQSHTETTRAYMLRILRFIWIDLVMIFVGKSPIIEIGIGIYHWHFKIGFSEVKPIKK